MALAAQGLAKTRPARAGRQSVSGAIERLGVLQIDAVNVLARAHYMPLYARLGDYDAGLLDALWLGPKRTLFEYWGHAASLMPLDAHKFWRWRMDEVRVGAGRYKHWAVYAKQNARYLDDVRAELRARGPLAASELSEAGPKQGPWWGWSEGKRALEYLFYCGEISVAARRNFARIYDLSERVFPAEILAERTPERDDAIRALTLASLQALGVGTAADIADYFRISVNDAKSALASLQEEGLALPARVEDWREPAFVHAEAQAPRKLHAHAVLSPFDPLIWRRDRALRLFGLDYRIEIYTPAEKRTYGYYALPFLMGETIAARVDLKAERAQGRLAVRAAHLEPGCSASEVAQALGAELALLARWQKLGEVTVARAGDLAPALKRALR
jgi:uncharacterized protein YcaQ